MKLWPWTDTRALLRRLQRVVFTQQNLLEDLRETVRNQHERHANQIADLRRQIEKLKGTHGA